MEGFGLTVAEALWKGKPVIASAVGGILLQITHKYSGILTRSIDGTAHYLKQLLNEPEYAKSLGANGKENIRNNFQPPGISVNICYSFFLFIMREKS